MTDIVTMVMDVTLDKIKAVAHVKPPGYSAPTGGDGFDGGDGGDDDGDGAA